MKLYGNKSNVMESGGLVSTSSFSIARTPHMFNILSNSLYSDKIGAVLREIGCNAVDAHIMAGKPEVPIEVKLPTRLDPSFYIKDWGPGLDHDEVTKLYTTYGWSNKQNSDEVTGAFGLGSKSPFAYTLQNEGGGDGFTVEAAKDGIKRIYTCFLNEEGVPTVAKLYEGPSEADWPAGVKVTFPVQAGDVELFHKKAVEIFSWFSVKPRILGLQGSHADFYRDGPNFLYEADNFKIRLCSPSIHGFSTEASVVMANVRYPIRLDKVYSGKVPPPHARELFDANIHFWVKTGEVSITPAREELEYTPITVRALQQCFDRAFDHIYGSFAEVLCQHSTSSRWQRCQALIALGRQITQAHPRDSSLVRYVLQRLEDNRLLHANDRTAILADGFMLTDGNALYYSSGDTTRGCRQARRYGISAGKLVFPRTEKPLFVLFSNPPKLVWQDDSKAKYADARLRQFSLMQPPEASQLLFFDENRHADPKLALQKFLAVNSLEGVSVLKLSELPQPDVPRTRETRDERLERLLDSKVIVVNRHTGKRDGFRTLRDIPQDERYYVETNRGKVGLALTGSLAGVSLRYCPSECSIFEKLGSYVKRYLSGLPSHVMVLTSGEVRELKGLLKDNYLEVVVRDIDEKMRSHTSPRSRYFKAFKELTKPGVSVQAKVAGFSMFAPLLYAAMDKPDWGDAFVCNSGNAELALDIQEIASYLNGEGCDEDAIALEEAKELFYFPPAVLANWPSHVGESFEKPRAVVRHLLGKYPIFHKFNSISTFDWQELVVKPDDLRNWLKLLECAAKIDAQDRLKSKVETAAAV